VRRGSPPGGRDDSDCLVAAVAAIYDAAAAPDRWPVALQAIADYFDDIGAVIYYRRDDGSFGTIVSPELCAAQADYEAGWWQHDIRASRSVEYGYRVHGGAITDRHLITEQEIETHPFYREFLAKHGLRWVAGTTISPDPKIEVALSVQRAATKQPFTDEELHDLTRIGRYAEKSLRLSIRLLDAELSNLGLREALSRLRIGVFALDSLGRVVFSNPAGESLLDDGLSVVSERLTAAQPAARRDVERAIARILSGAEEDLIADPLPLLVSRAQSRRPLTVYILPVGAGRTPTHDFLTHVRALVLAIDPEMGSPPDPTVVRDLLGLTLAEARVAALVGSGLPPREAAERLGIAEETARTALKRAFSKIGVSRQSELTGLLTRLVLR